MKKLISITVWVVLMLLVCTDQTVAQIYKVYVAAESEDEVALISFDARNAESIVEKTIPVGMFPTEIEGPHGIGVHPNGKYWYVSLGHGVPFGHLYKYETGTDRMLEKVELGMFPASLDISSETGWVYVVNFNLHGDHDVSSMSIVDGETMEELERIETGIMPHGSRLSSDGTMNYHVSMMTDELFEIDAFTLQVNRILKISESGNESIESDRHSAGHQNMGHSEPVKMSKSHAIVKPTWVSPNPASPYAYVAGNGVDKIYVIDLEKWRISDVWETSGKGPYNLEPTHDGKKIIVTYKGEGAVGIFDVNSGRELKKLSNSRKVTHGVAISPDNRYAFISVEGIGGEPGSVEVLDIEKEEIVDIVEIGKQAGGIAFWKMEE